MKLLSSFVLFSSTLGANKPAFYNKNSCDKVTKDQWDSVAKHDSIKSITCEANDPLNEIKHACALECKTGFVAKPTKPKVTLLCLPKGNNIKFNQRCVRNKKRHPQCKGKLCKVGVHTGTYNIQVTKTAHSFPGQPPGAETYQDVTGYYMYDVTTTNPITGHGNDGKGDFILSAGDDGFYMKKEYSNGDVANLKSTASRKFEGTFRLNMSPHYADKITLSGSMKPKEIDPEVVALINCDIAIGTYSGSEAYSVSTGQSGTGYYTYDITNTAPLAGSGVDDTGEFTISPGDDGFCMKFTYPDESQTPVNLLYTETGYEGEYLGGRGEVIRMTGTFTESDEVDAEFVKDYYGIVDVKTFDVGSYSGDENMKVSSGGSYTASYKFDITNTAPLTGSGADNVGRFIISPGDEGFTMKKTYIDSRQPPVNCLYTETGLEMVYIGARGTEDRIYGTYTQD